MIHFLLIEALTETLTFVEPALSAIAIRRSLPIRWQLILPGICIFYGISPILLAGGRLSLAKVLDAIAPSNIVAWMNSLVSFIRQPRFV